MRDCRYALAPTVIPLVAFSDNALGGKGAWCVCSVCVCGDGGGRRSWWWVWLWGWVGGGCGCGGLGWGVAGFWGWGVQPMSTRPAQQHFRRRAQVAATGTAYQQSSRLTPPFASLRHPRVAASPGGTALEQPHAPCMGVAHPSRPPRPPRPSPAYHRLPGGSQPVEAPPTAVCQRSRLLCLHPVRQSILQLDLELPAPGAGQLHLRPRQRL